MQLFEATKKRPVNLERLYNTLKTIIPTSVQPKRVFSEMDLFVSKIRNRLYDDTLYALIILCQHYKMEKKIFTLKIKFI